MRRRTAAVGRSSPASTSSRQAVASTDHGARLARPGDGEALASLLSEALAIERQRGGAERRSPLFALAPDALGATLLEAAPDSPMAVVVPADGGRLAGVAVFQPRAADALVFGVYVSPSLRRRGVGRTLVEAVATLASAPLTVLVAAGDRGEKSFAEALGLRAELLVMAARPPSSAPVRCAGVVVVEGGSLLLIRRAQAPGLGSWSLPGGRVEPGETPAAAARREALEETGLVVEVGEELGAAMIPNGAGAFEVHNFDAHVVGGRARAATDAAELRFVDSAELELLGVSEGLLAWLDAHGVLARLESFGG